jgi:hypothetical protein
VLLDLVLQRLTSLVRCMCKRRDRDNTHNQQYGKVSKLHRWAHCWAPTSGEHDILQNNTTLQDLEQLPTDQPCLAWSVHCPVLSLSIIQCVCGPSSTST